MEFRSKAKSVTSIAITGLVLVGLTAPAPLAQNHRYEIRREHGHGHTLGTLLVSPDGISFEEHGKKSKADSRQWTYQEIQQLTVSATELRILTYEDLKWELGRDREYVFDLMPKSLVVEMYPLWASKLDRRFIAAVSVPKPGAEWKSMAKLDHGLAGTVGSLTIGQDWVVFDAGKRGGSRSWRMMDIQNISRTGPLDFTVTSAEKSGWFRGASREFHFQLQQSLPEEIYNLLWRGINRAQGLAFLDSQQVKKR